VGGAGAGAAPGDVAAAGAGAAGSTAPPGARRAPGRRGWIRNRRSTRSVRCVVRRKSAPSTGTSPSTGTLVALSPLDSRTSPPTSRLSPSAISAWVLIAERSTTGSVSTVRSPIAPSSIATSSLMRTWPLSLNTCGVTRSDVPAETLKRSTSSRPATRTKKVLLLSNVASTFESVSTCGLDTTLAAPCSCSALMRARKSFAPPSTSETNAPRPMGVICSDGVPGSRRRSLSSPRPNSSEPRARVARQLIPSSRRRSVLRSMIVASISSSCGSTSSAAMSCSYCGSRSGTSRTTTAFRRGSASTRTIPASGAGAAGSGACAPGAPGTGGF
jgi:hypothetical protein